MTASLSDLDPCLFIFLKPNKLLKARYLFLYKMSTSIFKEVAPPEEDESHQAISSYFLGPKAENHEYFKKNMLEILEGQRDARLDYFPRDGVGFSHLIMILLLLTL